MSRLAPGFFRIIQRIPRALAASALLAGAAAADENAAPIAPSLLIEAQRFDAGKLVLSGRASCADDGKPKRVCTTSVRAVPAGSPCEAAPQGAGDAPADVQAAGGWSLAGLAPGTLYSVYARSSDGEKSRCSIALRVLTPRDDNALEAPSLDPFTERVESPVALRGTTVEGLLAVYRNGTQLPELVVPLASGEFIASVPLVKGLNELEVRAVNPYSGEQSPPSNTLELRISP